MRKKLIFFMIFSLALATAGASSFEAQSDAKDYLVITHANVIDGVSDRPLRDVTVVVRNGRIESVQAIKEETPSGATLIDLKGRWLLPGFVDAHVHVADLRAARAALRSGATTLRSMGVSHFLDKGIGELNRAGVADLPDVLGAGYHVRPHPAEELFLTFPHLKSMMPGISGPENVRRVVRAMIDRGAEVIKIMATERAGLPDTDPRKRVFSDDELAAAVDEARKSGVFVAAHAHGDEGARAAVRAGVRSIEHGTYLSDETLALMKDRGAYLVPTIATVADLIDPGGDYDNAVLSIRGRAMLPRVRETTARARRIGVKVIAGTDTGYGATSRRRMSHEVMELVEVGLAPMDAIKAATSESAACLGIDKRTGSIKPGLEADLIAVERDPLASIGAIEDVLLVINNGKIVVNRLSF
jgi:imidazolonepropionase-like amidohydrolase